MTKKLSATNKMYRVAHRDALTKGDMLLSMLSSNILDIMDAKPTNGYNQEDLDCFASDLAVVNDDLGKDIQLRRFRAARVINTLTLTLATLLSRRCAPALSVVITHDSVWLSDSRNISSVYFVSRIADHALIPLTAAQYIWHATIDLLAAKKLKLSGLKESKKDGQLVITLDH